MQKLVENHPAYIPMYLPFMEQYMAKEGLSGVLPMDIADGIVSKCSYEPDEDVVYSTIETWKYDEPNERQELFKKQEFIRALNMVDVVGNSPMEKAVNVIAALIAQSNNNGMTGHSHRISEDISNLIMRRNPTELARATEELLRNAKETMSDSFLEKVFNTEKKDSFVKKLLSLSKEDIYIVDKIFTFQKMPQISSSTKISRVEDPSLSHNSMRYIRNYSELNRIKPHDRLREDLFDYKLATKTLLVPTAYKSEGNAKSMFIIIDDSGSMCEPKKKQILFGLLYNRMQAVINDGLKLYMCTFEKELDYNEWIEVVDEKQALDTISLIKNGEYITLGRGDTNMQLAITQASKQIKSGTLHSRFAKDGTIKLSKLVEPSIIIINDGEDRVDANFVPPIKTHGFILMNNHKYMRNFCNRSGGIYKEFHY